MRSYLVPAKQSIKDQTSIGQLIPRKGVGLLHRAYIWRPGLIPVMLPVVDILVVNLHASIGL